MIEYSAVFEYPCGKVRKVHGKDNPKFIGCARFNNARPIKATLTGHVPPEVIARIRQMVCPFHGVVTVSIDPTKKEQGNE